MKNNMEIQKESQYRWHPTWANQITHNVDINKAISELETIKETRGEITPVYLVESARNKKSVFHDYFEWNDEKAAEYYRRDQARVLLRHIEITVIKDGNEKTSRAYEVISSNRISNEYKNVNILTEENLEFVKNACIADLQRVSKKLSFFSVFEKSVKHIDKAIELLSKEEEIKQVPIKTPVAV